MATSSSGLAAVWRDAEPLLGRLAERLCANRADACDLVQDTFERAARQGLPDDVRNPRAWLIAILRNLFVDRCRRRARAVRHEPLHDGIAGDATAMLDDPAPVWTELGVADVRAALGKLAPMYREVFEMHVFDRLSYDAIAERLAIERVTVGTRLTRARKKLRVLLMARAPAQKRSESAALPFARTTSRGSCSRVH